MNHYKLKNHLRQAGMTLIELTVVLLVLIGLAGLLLPYVSGFNQKTHDSVNSDNLASLNNAMARFMTENNVAPDNMESLTNGATQLAGVGTDSCAGATTIDTIWCGLLDNATLDTVTITAMNIGGIQAASLFQVGLSAVNYNSTVTTNKTFNSSIATTQVPAAGGTFARVACERDGTAAAVTGAACTAALRQQHLVDAFGGSLTDYDPTCYDYMAFGVGDSNQMIGRTMSASPIHFATNGDQGPLANYNHYIAVFKVDRANSGNGANGTPCSTLTDPAKFVGAAMVVPQFANSKLYGQVAGVSFAYENQDAAAN